MRVISNILKEKKQIEVAKKEILIKIQLVKEEKEAILEMNMLRLKMKWWVVEYLLGAHKLKDQ